MSSWTGQGSEGWTGGTGVQVLVQVVKRVVAEIQLGDKIGGWKQIMVQLCETVVRKVYSCQLGERMEET